MPVNTTILTNLRFFKFRLCYYMCKSTEWYTAVAINYSILLYPLNHLSWNNYCFLCTEVYNITDTEYTTTLPLVSNAHTLKYWNIPKYDTMKQEGQNPLFLFHILSFSESKILIRIVIYPVSYNRITRFYTHIKGFPIC